MPYLSEVFGYILSEITTARLQADLESMRIADLYAGDSLLKHMPIPHFRLPELNVDIPLAITDIEENGEKITGRDAIIASSEESVMFHINSTLEEGGVVLTDQEKQSMANEIKSTTSRMRDKRVTALNSKKIVDELLETAVTGLRMIRISRERVPERNRRTKKAKEEHEHLLKALSDENLKAMSSTLIGKVSTDISKKILAEPANIRVLANTAEIREAGPTNVLAMFHLSIKEEAYEWATMESDGNIEQRLVPE